MIAQIYELCNLLNISGRTFSFHVFLNILMWSRLGGHSYKEIQINAAFAKSRNQRYEQNQRRMRCWHSAPVGVPRVWMPYGIPRMVFGGDDMFIEKWTTRLEFRRNDMFVIVVVIINIPSLPNQRQMRFWHLAGLKSISHSQIIL